MKYSKNYIEMHNTPTLKQMIKGDRLSKEEKKIAKEVLKQREENFFKNATKSAIYHENN
jgi:hypothetical protein|tara:strand:+ start:955 stop:1131 length:177 start_codon:yes stop_codon:yes gene_type:complete